MTKREQDKATRDFTNKLCTFAKLLGGEMHREDRVQESGNGGNEDSAYVFTVKVGPATFNVEVFGDGS